MAGEILEKLSQDEKARAIYQQRRKWYLYKVSSEKYLLNKGREGERKAIALRLIKKGMDNELITRVTKLTESEIEEIRKEISH